jgi:hypothetical protein
MRGGGEIPGTGVGGGTDCELRQVQRILAYVVESGGGSGDCGQLRYRIRTLAAAMIWNKVIDGTVTI